MSEFYFWKIKYTLEMYVEVTAQFFLLRNSAWSVKNSVKLYQKEFEKWKLCKNLKTLCLRHLWYDIFFFCKDFLRIFLTF